MKYDYLVYAVGAETQTFNIPGVREHALFMKELDDGEKVLHHFDIERSTRLPVYQMQRRFLDCEIFPSLCDILLVTSLLGLESAAFPGQIADEVDRLLHVVNILSFVL